MPDISDELLAIEKGFWSGGESYFRQHTDKECLIAFTQMAGVMSRDELAATAKQGNRWRDLEIDVVGAVYPKEGVAILSYKAAAVRENGEPYAALVSTGYVRRDDGWKMMFHAHTPQS
jgi:hypothetical protein